MSKALKTPTHLSGHSGFSIDFFGTILSHFRPFSGTLQQKHKGWLQTVKLRPLVEIKLARPIRSQYFRFSINKPQDQSFFFLVQKHHVWTVLICFSNLKCGDKSVTVETGDVSWGEGRSYLLFLIVDEWNITWSRPYLITFFVKHCVQIHDSWRFQGILELPMWTT